MKKNFIYLKMLNQSKNKINIVDWHGVDMEFFTLEPGSFEIKLSFHSIK